MRLLRVRISGGGFAPILFRATAGSAIVRVVGMGLTFLVGVQLARGLGPQGYGDYGTVMAIVALLTVPAQLGLPQLLTRELSAFVTTGSFGRVKGAMIWFVSAVAVASLTFAVLGWLATQLWPRHGGDTLSRALFWGLASIPFTAVASLAVASLRGFHHVVGAQLYDALLRPLLFAVLIWCVTATTHLDASTALLLQMLSACATLGICAIHLVSVLPKSVRKAAVTRHSRVWIASALPMAGTEVLRVFDGQYAVLLLGLLTTLDQVGIFRIALAASLFIGLPSTILNVVVMPYIAQFHAANDRERLQKILSGSTLAMFASVGAMTLGLAIFGKGLLTFVFGAAFAPAALPLVLMSVAYLINSAFGSAATLLNMCDRERIVAAAFMVGPIVGICVTCLTFRWFGIAAASIALIAAETIKGLIMWRSARRVLGVDPSLLGALFPLWSRTEAPSRAQANFGSA